MRIDVVSIFPAFFEALEVSLLGRARGAGILDIRVHDLRDSTHDRHRTVDDTPYGGGAGMVMKPEPWAEALQTIATDAEAPPGGGQHPIFIFPSPAGEVFTQATAGELAEAPHLVFGCGRYEGIDERVFDYAAELGSVRLISLGDYVLNGGEVAAMAMIEAIGRLVPGVVGNPASLVEESHEDGLLEYPSYTKPAAWRGRDVPPVLLSGNHGAIAAWRREQQIERTRARRPDLLGE
ncbi:tRNA (guanosine(37)-N1)-methyltransferase TrmD [Microbacterium sp. P05]|uniref:tRNA (guanosine(37)-N1)-methyltransferase TrmD n=1 Tax=Microbacterium sp. P05 TaxID=3366948 RepID=UPI0037475683